MGRACSAYGGEAYTGFWWGNLRKGDPLEDQGTDGKIILKWISKKWDREAWTRSIWVWMGTGGEQW